jgi:Ca-activated chloride channel family protein
MMPSHPMPSPVSLSPDPSSGSCVVLVDPKTLPLRDVKVAASAGGGIARVVLEQRFHNPHTEPLTVSYLFPLPEGAAVSGYAFTIGDRRIVGEVDKKTAARERFEQALTEGRSAALLEQERSSLFTQELGNIPPGADVVAEIILDQPLRWLEEGSWEWRFPLASAPRYLGAPGRVVDAARVTHLVGEQALDVRASLELRVRDAIAHGRKPESPSHAMRATDEGAAQAVRFDASAGVPLDRDVVVHWGVAASKPGVRLDVMRSIRSRGDSRGSADVAYGLLTVVPPLPEARLARVPRDLVVLLDTSGSMGGAPLDQARRVTGALVDTLTEGDQLELLEFGNRARHWKRGPVPATPANKKDAHAWLASLKAGGGTEMRSAIEEAMSGLRAESQRQVVVVTDGQIGFESEVVAATLARLPASSRVHTVGVGSAVNRSLTGPLARAGRGVEVVIALDEDPEKAARRIVLRTDAPLVIDLNLSGSALLEHAPSRLPDLFAGSPVLVAAKLRPEGGELVVRGRGVYGEWVEHLAVSSVEVGEGEAGVGALFGREHVEDLELQICAGGEGAKLEAAIERIGLELQIATRMTSFIAATEERTVDPREPTRRARVPQNLPYGMSVEGLGLRAGIGVPQGALAFGDLASELGAPMTMERYRSAGVVSRSARPALPPAGMAPPRAAGRPLAPAAPRRGEPLAKTPERTLLGRAVDAVRGIAGAGGSAASAGPTGLVERHARGRLVSHNGNELTIEVTIDELALAWAPRDAEVILIDGTRVSASIVSDRSTREGLVPAGTTLRVVVALGQAIGALPKTVRITLDGVPLVVLL